MTKTLEQNPTEIKTAIDRDFQSVAEILPEVLHRIVMAAQLHAQHNPNMPDARNMRWGHEWRRAA